MKISVLRIVSISAFLLVGCMLPSIAFSQEVTIQARGVSGDVDTKGRDPHVTVTRLIEENQVRLLVDVEERDRELQSYPIKVEYYVNRHLFASQIRSPTLPGALGIVVGSDIATPPFNYTVVATVITPNKRYSTVIEGAAFSSELNRRLDCTFSITLLTTEGVEQEQVFVANDVLTQQTGNGTFVVSFLGNDLESNDQVRVSSTVDVTNIDDPRASTSYSLTDLVNTFDSTVEVELSNNILSAFELSSEEQMVRLRCS